MSSICGVYYYSRALAEMALMGQTSGVYLVRESETVSGSYSLSVRVDINVKYVYDVIESLSLPSCHIKQMKKLLPWYIGTF